MFSLPTCISKDGVGKLPAKMKMKMRKYWNLGRD